MLSLPSLLPLSFLTRVQCKTDSNNKSNRDRDRNCIIIITFYDYCTDEKSTQMLRRRLSEINNYHKQQRPHVAEAGAGEAAGVGAGGSSSGAPCQCLPQHITVGDKGCCGYAYSEQLRPLAFIKCQNGGTTGHRQWHGAWGMLLGAVWVARVV